MSVDAKLLLSLMPEQFKTQVIGRQSDDYVLFLDLWGTSELLSRFQQSGDLLDQANIAHTQTHFVSTLGRLCKELPRVNAHQISDCAFVFSKDLSDLLTFACTAFKNMTFRLDKFMFCPLRGGISKGLFYFADGGTLKALSNFKYTAEIGTGMVEAATLEKKGPKGMRLFTSEALTKEIPQSFQSNVRATKDIDNKDILEVNWMRNDHFFNDYLNANIESQSMNQHLTDLATVWSTKGNNYQQQVGNSLIDLLNW